MGLVRGLPHNRMPEWLWSAIEVVLLVIEIIAASAMVRVAASSGVAGWGRPLLLNPRRVGSVQKEP